jgi:hypothetical protein
VARPLSSVLVAAAALALAGRAGALVTVSGPDDGSVFYELDRPGGQLDETGLSGFELLISSRTGSFRANDQYLIAGEATEETTSIGSDLGGVAELSGTSLEFAIEHHLAAGRNFTFRVRNTSTGAESALCWGVGCEAGSLAVELLNGIPPIQDYNGLQVQVRAQDVAGSSAALTLEALTGVDLAGAPLFDEVVTPSSPGTISPLDAGRRGQWLLGDDLDLVENEWELRGTLTLARPDAALEDLTKVRLAVDLVRHPELPFLPAPEPAGALLVATAVALLAPLSLRRRSRPRPDPSPAQGADASVRGRTWRRGARWSSRFSPKAWASPKDRSPCRTARSSSSRSSEGRCRGSGTARPRSSRSSGAGRTAPRSARTAPSTSATTAASSGTSSAA